MIFFTRRFMSFFYLVSGSSCDDVHKASRKLQSIAKKSIRRDKKKEKEKQERKEKSDAYIHKSNWSTIIVNRKIIWYVVFSPVEADIITVMCNGSCTHVELSSSILTLNWRSLCNGCFCFLYSVYKIYFPLQTNCQWMISWVNK